MLRSTLAINRTDENVMTDINYGNWGLQEGLWSRDLDINQLIDLLNRSVEELKQILSSLPNRERTIEFDRRLQLIESKVEATIKARASRIVEGEVLRFDLEGLMAEKEARIETLERMIEKYELTRTDKQQRLASIEEQLRWNLQLLAEKDRLLNETTFKLEEEIKRSGYLRDALNTMKRNIDGQRGRNDIDKIALRGVNLPSNLGDSSGVNFQELSKMTMTRKDEKEMVMKSHILTLMKDMEDYLRGVKILSVDAITNTLRPLMAFLNITAIDQPHLLYRRMRERVQAIASLYHSELTKIKQAHPQLQDVQLNPAVQQLQKESGVDKVSIVEGFVYLEKGGSSLQLDQIRRVMNTIIIELKAISERYPKLKEELSQRGLLTIMEQPLWKLGDLRNVTQIIQYVPEPIRVENTTKIMEKSKTQLHLRALLKALLTDLQLAQQGRQGFLDQAIIKGLSGELEQFQDLEQLFRLYYPVSRGLQEVEKVVEKIVEKIVQVPRLITVDRVVEKLITVDRIVQVDKPIHIPVEVIKVVEIEVERIVEVEKIVERIVEVPTVVEKLIEVIREVEKIIEVERIVEVEIIKEREVIVEKQVPCYITEIKEIEVFVDRLVPVETIVERIVEVPVIMERIETVIREVPKIVEVEKFIDRPYKVVEDREVRLIENHIQVKYEPVERIVEKLIPVIKIEEKLVEVERIVEKVVRVVQRQEIIKEVEVFRDVIVERQVPVEVIRTVQQVVPLIQEVIKEVVRRVDVPIIVEKLVMVPVEIVRVQIQTIQRQKIKEVPVEVIRIVKERQVVQLEKIVHHIERVPEVVTIKVDKIVQIPLISERVREERVIVEKIIEKLVEVPKVVEVERIVEKIIVVPRIVEKIVQVPQIVERIVQRIVEVEKIVEVQRIVQVPVIEEKIVFVDRLITQVVEQEVAVDRPVQRLVPVQTIVERIIEVEKLVERPVELRQEVPKQLIVQKIVPVMKQVEKLVEREVQKLVTLEVKTPVDRIVEKLVQVEHYVEKILTEPVIRENVRVLKDIEVKLVQIERFCDKIVVEKEFVEIERSVPIVHNQIVEVQLQRTVNVPVECAYEVVKEVPVAHEKVVEVRVQRTGFHQVEKQVEKLVKVPQVVEVERTVPVILLQQQSVNLRQDNVITVPLIQQQIKQIQVQKQKTVPIVTVQQVVQLVDRDRERVVIQKEIQQIERIVNYIQKELQPIDRFEQKIVELKTIIEKIVEVPTIVEKIVEKIIMMPQVVELTRQVNTIQMAEELDGPVKQRRILTDLELIDIFAVTLDKVWRVHNDIQTGLPEDIVQMIEAKTAPKTLTKSAVFNSNLTAYTQQTLNSSRTVNTGVSIPANRTSSELVELMAARLYAIKEQQPQVDLGASEGLYKSYLTNRGRAWLDMERNLDKSRADLQRTRILTERNSDIMHTLKLSYDILMEKYKKQDSLLGEIRALAEKLNIAELLDILPEPKTERSIGLVTDRNPPSERVTVSPLRSSIISQDINLKQLHNDLQQKLELLTLREKELAALKNDLSTINARHSQSNEELRKQMGRYNDQTRVQQEEIRVLRLAKETAEQDNIRMRKEMNGLQVEYGLFKKQSIELKAKLSKTELNKSIQDVKNSYQAQLKQLRTALEQNTAKYERESTTLRQSIESVEVARTNALRDVDTLKAQLKQQGLSKSDAIKRVEQLQLQLNSIRLNTQSSGSEISGYLERIRILEREILELKAQLDEARKSGVTQQQHITKLTEEQQQLHHEIHNKDKDLLFFRKDNDKLERAKTSGAKEMQAYQNQITITQKQNLLLIEEVKTLRARCDELDQELARTRNTDKASTKTQSVEIGTVRKQRATSGGDMQARVQTEPSSTEKEFLQRMFTQPAVPTSPTATNLQVNFSQVAQSGSQSPAAVSSSTLATMMTPVLSDVPTGSAVGQEQRSPRSESVPMSPMDLLRTEGIVSPTKSTVEVSQPKPVEGSTVSLSSLIGMKVEDMLASNIILIIIDRLRDEIRQGRMNVYDPKSIVLTNYNPAKLQNVEVQLLDPVNQSQYRDCVYCSPQLIRGELPTEKSLVYSIGLIWDELLHGQRLYNSTEEILNKVNDYKVRNSRINPIFKNSLFEMLNKDPTKRINFNEVRGRLSLQKYIHREERGYAERSRRERPPQN